MKIHCTTCEYEGKHKNYTKGSLMIEIALWLLFIFPGVIYTIWRNTSGKYKGCPDCKSESVVELKRWNKRQLMKEGA